MNISLPLGIVVAAIAWIILYVIIGIPLWIAFVVAGAIIVLTAVTAGGAQKARS